MREKIFFFLRILRILRHIFSLLRHVPLSEAIVLTHCNLASKTCLSPRLLLAKGETGGRVGTKRKRKKREPWCLSIVRRAVNKK